MTPFDPVKTVRFVKTAAYGVWLLFTPLLVIAGLTGAIQAFYYEIDEALNPAFYNVPVTTSALPAPELIARLEAVHPELKVWYIQSPSWPGRTAMMTTEPSSDNKLANDTFYVDPATGREVGARLWGECCLERRNFTNWTYELHHSLTSGEIGRWLMGLAALVGGAACMVYIVRGVRRRDRRSLTGAAIALPLPVIAGG